MSPRRRPKRGRLLRLLFLLLLLLLLPPLYLRFWVFRQARYHLPTTPVTLTTADGLRLSARLLDRDAPDLVVVLHGALGNSRSAEVVQLAEELAVEFDVLVLDLRGHGESEGVYAFDFAGPATDLEATLAWGREQGYRRIGVAGFSLGGAAAILAQARGGGADSLVVVSCPANDRVRSPFGPWAWSPAGQWLLRWFLDTQVGPPAGEVSWPADLAQQVAPVPLLVVHGERDPIVPAGVSESLYQAAHEPKAYLSLPTGHAALGAARREVRSWFHDTLLLEDLAPLPWAHFFERSLSGGPPPLPQDQGILAGTVYAEGGTPLAGALVLLSSEAGHTFTAYSGPDGRFRLEAPIGRYVPIATAPGHEAALYRHGSDSRTPVDLPAGGEVAVEFTLPAHRSTLPDPRTISLTLSAPLEVGAPQPRPVTAHRRQVLWAEGDHRVDTCLLYEPLTATLPLPVILAVYPSEAIRWDLVSVPMAASGYVVLACGPPYVEDLGQLDLPRFARDLALTWQLLEAGRLSSVADPSRYAILTGSISTFILPLALPDMPPPRVLLGIGGGYDLFLVLRDLYENPDYLLEQRFAMGLAALGRPDLYPETFLSVSLRYHATALPPLALFHSDRDEVLLVDQSEAMAETMEALGRPVELYRYYGLAHYPGVEDPPPETLRMYAEMMDVFRRYLYGQAPP